MREIEFSIVIPVYQSEKSLGILCDEIVSFFNERSYTFEIVLVDDHSSDNVWQEILELKKKYQNEIVAIRLAKNFGQNGATLCGIDNASGSNIITIDDDLQIKPSEIEKLLKRQAETNADVVYGTYNQQEGLIRRLGSNLIKGAYRSNEGSGKIGSSFRLIRENVVLSLKNHSHDHLFINQVIAWYTNDIELVEVEKSQRAEGKSGYSLYKLIGIGLRLIFYYSSIPLKIAIYLGISTAVICMFIAAYYVYKKYAHGAEMGFTAIIVSLFAIAGVIITFISILAIYINRLYNSRVKKPHYSIKVKH